MNNIPWSTHALTMCLYRGKQDQYYGRRKVDRRAAVGEWQLFMNRPETFTGWVGRMLCLDMWCRMVEGSGLETTKVRVSA